MEHSAHEKSLLGERAAGSRLVFSELSNTEIRKYLGTVGSPTPRFFKKTPCGTWGSSTSWLILARVPVPLWSGTTIVTELLGEHLEEGHDKIRRDQPEKGNG